MSGLTSVGKRMIFWGALALTIWAGYELYIRLDAMAKPLGMFFSLVQGEKIPLVRAARYVDWSILAIPGYLAVCIVTGLWGLLMRNRPFTAWLMLAVSVALAVWGEGIRALLLPSLWDLVKLMPLVMIFLGSLFCIIGRAALRRIPPAGGASYRDGRMFHQDK